MPCRQRGSRSSKALPGRRAAAQPGFEKTRGAGTPGRASVGRTVHSSEGQVEVRSSQASPVVFPGLFGFREGGSAGRRSASWQGR
jgi:hypothetical protein